MSDDAYKPSRRGLLTGALGGALGIAVGAGTVAAISGTSDDPAPSTAVAADGPNQAGIHRPVAPQQFGRLVVLDAAGTDRDWIAGVGARILELAGGSASDLLPDGPGDLTMSVGLGPRLVAAIDPSLPGTEALPPFVGDDRMPPSAIGGDLLLSAYSSDPTVLGAVLDDLAALIPGATVRWQQAMFRGAGEGTKARNPLGFMDGIVVPHGDDELAESVWIGSGPLAGATICVVRRLQLDTARFRSLETGRREAVIGRKLRDGSPLSGGKPDDQVDLRAKTAEGEFLVPARAHARAAHPSFTGSPLMLRRSYSFDDGGDDHGLVFISFQNTLRAFTATQHRLDEVDDLMGFVTPTASATFLMLPGFSDGSPLGSTL